MRNAIHNRIHIRPILAGQCDFVRRQPGLQFYLSATVASRSGSCECGQRSLGGRGVPSQVRSLVREGESLFVEG